jgi:hypothetical protein
MAVNYSGFCENGSGMTPPWKGTSMKRLLAALTLVAAAALIGGPAIAQQGDTVSFCHVPPGNPDNPQFFEDMPLEAWENGHDGGQGQLHSLDFLTDDEDECLNPGDDDDDGDGGDDDDDDDGDDGDGDDDDGGDDDNDNDGALASTGA